MSSSNSSTLADSSAREQALNINHSCIVQAPAGSGKTELLTLRYLSLLSVSKQPEEVLAITFTRKAASEMRDRILSTLAWAVEIEATGVVPEKDFEKQRLGIARNVINHDKECNWNLLKNPSRLRVQTIDSFCFYLANQMPVLSGVGGNPVLSEDVDHIYHHAIHNTLSMLDKGVELSDDIALLLQHLDNNTNRVEKLLADLLNKRDQWVSHVLFIKQSGQDAQDYLLESLQDLVAETLETATHNLIPSASKVTTLLRFAAHNRRAEGALWENIEMLTTLPDGTACDLPIWKILADLFLTKEGKWRARIDKRQGFPAGDKSDKEFDSLCKQRKQEFNELSASLKEQAGLTETLDYIRRLPDPDSESKQWAFLSALTRVLIHMSGELLLSFSQFGMMDYAQAGAAARNSLGSEENPTDLAMSLDHAIQHILVDEFQDTSQLQLEILQQLTAGWQPGDNRSLFLVGDAMQSCYGFRNANVGIYLNVREHGIGEIQLNSLTLQTNFRSQEKIVTWVNQVFSQAFPPEPNSSRGAVPYSVSVPVNKAEPIFGVSAQVIQHQSDDKLVAQQAEANAVIYEIKSIQLDDPKASIAILVRSRSHLAKIIPLLKEYQIPWLATDIDRLGTLPVIEDLLSLTKALLNLADRVAWLSVLRAPWCGLTSGDLFAITEHVENNSIWSGLLDFASSNGSDTCQVIAGLSTDGAARLSGIVKVLHHAISIRFRVPLRDLIESTWTLLKGVCTATNDEAFSIAHYFTLLEQYELGNGLLNVADFQERVSQSFVSPPVDTDNSNPVNILTMHKSKGLEFDHIILPGLNRSPASDDKQLLQWYERLNASGDNRLFLTTQTAVGNEENKLYDLMRYEQQQKNLLEDTRLLYIAVTRARTSALLLGTISEDSKGEYHPPKGCLLSRIWPQLDSGNFNLEKVNLTEEEKQLFYGEVIGEEASRGDLFPDVTPINRFESPLELNSAELNSLTLTIEKTSPPASAEIDSQDEKESAEPEAFEHDNPLASAIGTLIHSSLESYAISHEKDLWLKKLSSQRNFWRLYLRQHLDDEAELEAILDRVQETIKSNTANDEFTWIFDEHGLQAQSELGLTNQHNRLFVVDRTLIDKEGVRWIIDFKTGHPKPSQTNEAFIQSMKERYQSQLLNYGNLFAELESRKTKLALFLTSIEELVEL
ncbi:MAG: ATP-dependent helicase/nuclease subunit A [Pseudohongiellaceae bacterium]|jgi:ATP-dependent helicase/nuclease subunit A